LPRKSYVQIGIEFEKSVQDFLHGMDFNDINGGADFRIGGKQIDASFGTSSKTYVIVSCTTRSNSGSKGSIESKINELKSWYQSLLKGLSSIDSLKNYNDLRLVLATKGIILSDRDKELCKNEPKVYVWDEQFFKYYDALQSKIGLYAKYELQRELDIRLQESEFEKFKDIPSLKISIDNGNFYYLTAMDPSDLLKLTYVARRERGDQSFYQRMIKEDKVKKIAYQIQKTGLSFYNNLILSTLDEVGIEFSEIKSFGNVSLGNLTFNNYLNSLWIVDGQHRLYGYSKVKDYSKLNQPKIPLSLIVNKSEVEQGSIFITINTNQTVLSDDYKWDLYGVYKDNFKRNVSALTPKYLNKLSNLNGKIYIPSMSPVRIKGNIGISKIGRTIYEQPKLFYGNLDDNRPNPIIREKKEKDDDEKNANQLAKFLDSCLTLVEKNDPWLQKFFITTTGIQIYIILLSNHLVYYAGSEDKVGEYLKLLCESTKISGRFNTDAKIKKLEQSLNSREEKSRFIGELIGYINDRIVVQGKKIKPIPEISRKVSPHEVEKIIRDFIKDRLHEESAYWFQEFVPTDVKDALKTKFKWKTEEEMWEFIDLGSLIKIVDNAKNWEKIFKKVFLENGKSSFSDKYDFIYTVKNFKKMRDPESHGRPVEFVDKKLGEAAADKIRLFIEHFNEETVDE
jgi:DGQHR domain-containing protein